MMVTVMIMMILSDDNDGNGDDGDYDDDEEDDDCSEIASFRCYRSFKVQFLGNAFGLLPHSLS